MQEHYLTFKIFNQFPEVDSRFYGKDLGGWVEKKETVTMRQIHSNNIVYIEEYFPGKIVKDVDGLITKKKNVFLMVKIADCIPIFFYEPRVKAIGVVHAGWKGTLLNIVGKMINNIVRHGGRAENIFAAIGPCIHECCYNVLPDRFLKFKNSFSDFSFEKPNFLDLGEICAFQMIKLGVLENHIEISSICTKCSRDKFYSFRVGDRNINNIGVIGMKEI